LGFILDRVLFCCRAANDVVISTGAKRSGEIRFLTIKLMRAKLYYVYIMASRSRTIYTGVTSDLCTRVQQHRKGALEGFITRYLVQVGLNWTAKHIQDRCLVQPPRTAPISTMPVRQ
jgi:hypothetical protein